MLAQALPRSLTLVGVCYSSGFQTMGVSRVLSVRERCFQNYVLEGRELRARAVGPLIPALIRTVLEMRTAIGKGLLTHQFRTYALTCFWNSCSCIYTPHVVLLDPFCDGEACFNWILYWDQALFLESFNHWLFFQLLTGISRHEKLEKWSISREG